MYRTVLTLPSVCIRCSPCPRVHQVLTDDATRENYEKYGNPDGYHGTPATPHRPPAHTAHLTVHTSPRRTADSARRCVAAGTSVTIGLPSWLTNKENELAILVAYFLVSIRAAHGALPRRAPPPRCTADSMHRVWHR